MALRIERELPEADEHGIRGLYNDLMAFWSRGLLPHFRTENECLLARLVRHVDQEDELIRRTQRDHLSMEALVATMRDAEAIEGRRDALARFGDSLRDHIRWEEEVLFSEVERLLGRKDMTALRGEIDERQPEQPAEAPQGPSTGSSNPKAN